MEKFTLLFVLSIVFLLTAVHCNPDKLDPDKGCFANKPLETIPWAKDELASFQRPKSGPLWVTVYSYKREYFLAFENVFLSSPMSHIFDCSGKNISERNIRYNDFTAGRKKVRLLLEGSC
ncbi:hypothetical protein [Persicitalea sp.]|uniref:hypothetical protein n=1 Tax=Persicitalea sp. TaxID=3100273 RepID=UPI0035938D04